MNCQLPKHLFGILLISSMSISYKFTKFEFKEIKKKQVKENTIPFWTQPTSKLEFQSTEEQKIKEETMEKRLGLDKKSYGT